MQAVPARWKDGRVCFDSPVDWPDGIELEVSPCGYVEDAVHRPDIDSSGDDIPFSDADVESTDPAAIARWIKEFESFPRVEMTDAEYENWQAWRRRLREHELQTSAERMNRVMTGQSDG